MLSAFFWLGCSKPSQEHEKKPVAEARLSQVELVEKGHRLHRQLNCGSCHSTTGVSLVGPAVNDIYGTEVTLIDRARVVRDEEYMKLAITDPARHLVAGFGNTMPAYRLDDGSVDALVAYIRSLTRQEASPHLPSMPHVGNE